MEGQRDERALRQLGMKGPIYQVQSSGSLLEVCERVAEEHKEVLLFLDLDKEGKRITKTVKKYLTDKGVKVDTKLQKKIMRTLETRETENLSRRYDKACKQYNYP